MPAKSKWEYYSEEELKDFYLSSSSFKEMFLKMGYSRYNTQTLSQMREKYNWLTPYFKGKDLKGKKFGRLFVTDLASAKEGRVYWKCRCDCGNETEVLAYNLTSGQTQSCGCYGREQRIKAQLKDISNQKFGRLIPVCRNPDNLQEWECRCDCGNKVFCSTHSLLSGHTRSCGCLQKEITKQINFIDLTGNVYNKLTVLRQDLNANKKVAYWICQCECGNIVSIASYNLRNGLSKSCGCIESHGEEKISFILNELKISYEREKSFKDLIGQKNLLKFDFYLNDYNILIEFQGIQHYESILSWGGESKFKLQQENDRKKQEYCYNNGIKLITIPYWDYNKLDKNYLISLLKGDNDGKTFS